MQHDREHVLVLGLGESGLAAAELLLAQGADVVVADMADHEAVTARAAALRAVGATVVTGSRTWPQGAYDLCVVSPGLPVDSGWVAEVAAQGVPVISELELAFRHGPDAIIGITGTNGKSTLTRLCGDMLAVAGIPREVGGNYGTPACRTVLSQEGAEWRVWEVSSFQLETCPRFAPRVGVLLNVQPDHLDRHKSMAHYYELKVSMLTRMKAGGVAIVPASQREAIASRVAPGVTVQTFGVEDGADYMYRDQQLVHGAKTLSLEGPYFSNAITGRTAAAAWAVADACGVSCAHVETAISRFEPLYHRMQQVSVHQGVTYVDDSKATNLSALAAGVCMAQGPVRLIAGGRDKAEDLSLVKEVLANRVQSVYLVGEAAPAMHTAWQEVVDCRICGDMMHAVKAAALDAQSGEWVLLSPGCASFDQYPNYKVRGDHFAELVKQLET